MKSGSIYALSGKNQIKYIKSFLINSLFIDNTNKKDKKNFSMSKFKLFASAEMDKIVISNEYFMGIWSQNEFDPLLNKDNSEKNKKNKIPNQIEELNGTFYNISLEAEKKIFLSNDIQLKNHNSKQNNSTSANSSVKFIENLTTSFGSNYYLGSFGRILYILLLPTELNNTFKVHFVDYLFRYQPNLKLKQNCIDNPSQVHESIRQIEKKIVFSYINFSNDQNSTNKPDLSGTEEKEVIIMRYNKLSNICAIVVNCLNPYYSNLILFMNETYRVSTYKLFEITTKFRLPMLKDNDKSILWVEDIEWICNDMLIIILFSQGYFCILNTSFQVLSIIDTSNCLINEGVIQRFSCPVNLYNSKLKFSDKIQLLSSKKRSDYFIIYSNTYTICFQANSKAFESRIISQNRIENFEDFLYLTKFYQIHYIDPETQKNMFEFIHMYIYNMHKDLYNLDQEHLVPNENLHNIFRVFIRFVRIFRNINLLHETNLTILNYLLQISNDFFYILINNKEIWLAFLYINLCENYLLKNLKIKIPKNKINDEQIQKGQASYLLMNPYFIQNSSLKNYSKLRNKILHSRLRLILIFLALIEFRNNQALNINVLYFVLGKNCIEKLKKNNMLDDIQMIVKAIIRNYKYLKNENSRAGGEEYILNGLSMNYRSEVLSNLIHSRISREDIKFDFFNDFFPLEDMQNYHDINNNYFKGDEEILINEYNYMNNLGVIQKWLLLFSNFCYFFLFEEIKIYVDNHVRQYLVPNKSAENITPEETSLSNLIFFNFLFLQLCLNNTIKFILSFITQKLNYKSDSSFCPDDTGIVDNFSKILLPTLSPVDIPFLIYEYYVTEDNKNKKNLPYEINQTLNEKILKHLKPYNFSMNEAMDFLEFLHMSNFCSENSMKENNRLQKFIFSGFIYYFLNINKLSQLQNFENERDFILKIIDSLDPTLKKDAYDLIYIILNGYLRFYLNMEMANTLDLNSSKHMEFILTFLKTIFYKLVREEPLRLRYNIFEYIYISPSIMKPYLLEGGLFYEYKTFNKIYKKNIFSTFTILDVKYFYNFENYMKKKSEVISSESNNNVSNVEGNAKVLNVLHDQDLNGKNPKNYRNSLKSNSIEKNKRNLNNFVGVGEETLFFLDELLNIGEEENDFHNLNSNWILENIFMTEEINNFLKETIKNQSNNSNKNLTEKKLYEIKEAKKDFVNSLKNFIFLIKHNESRDHPLIYEIEHNKEHNKKIIINFIKEIKKENNQDTETLDILGMCLDKIIIGNFDDKINFKFSNVEIKKKIIKSIKLSIIKYIHILNILLIKYFVFKYYNPKNDLLNYLKFLSLLLIYDKDPTESIKNSLVIIDTLCSLKWTEKKAELEIKIILEIIKHVGINLAIYKKNLSNYSKMPVLEELINQNNSELNSKIKVFFNEEISKIIYVYENLENFKSENLKLFFTSLFIDSYFENLKILQDNLGYYLSKQSGFIPLMESRKYYLKICEAYTGLTGIPLKSYIYFVENWDLVSKDSLHNMIINDNFDDYFNPEQNPTKRNDNKYNFIMNRRQKYGSDTPRRRRNSLKLNKNYVKNINENNTPEKLKIGKKKIRAKIPNFSEGENTKSNNIGEYNSVRSNESIGNLSVDLREEKNENVNENLNNSGNSLNKQKSLKNFNMIKIKKNNNKNNMNKNMIPRYRKDSLNSNNSNMDLNNNFTSNNNSPDKFKDYVVVDKEDLGKKSNINLDISSNKEANNDDSLSINFFFQKNFSLIYKFFFDKIFLFSQNPKIRE